MAVTQDIIIKTERVLIYSLRKVWIYPRRYRPSNSAGSTMTARIARIDTVFPKGMFKIEKRRDSVSARWMR